MLKTTLPTSKNRFSKINCLKLEDELSPKRKMNENYQKQKLLLEKKKVGGSHFDQDFFVSGYSFPT